MNNTNSHYDDKICEAIEYIVDNAVKQAEYDKTIQATIVRTVDQTIGKFSVKYQDSIFYAYGSPDTKYSNGAEVYVLIPGNDTSREKTILGSTKKLGTNYINNPEGEDAFEVIGMNVLKNSSEFGLCSYNGEYTQIVYNRENNINDIGLDVVAAETYIKQSSTILCGANIRTALPIEQQIRGNYGIIFELAFSNSSGDINTKNYVLDVNQMQGNPYRLVTESRQFGIFEIDGENFQYVNKIYFFVSNFPNKATDKPNDIFIKNLELSAVEKLSTEALSSYSLSFITPQGTYFDATHLDTETKSIQAQVRIKGKAIDKDSQKLDYYWFVENAAINYMNEKYNRYGGPGWECINTYTVIREAADPEPAVIEWNPASYELIVTKTDIVGKERRYKCVAIYDDENIVSREITITNLSALYELSIESSEGTQFYFDIGSPTLTCKINGEERLEGYSYSWGRVDNTGTFTELVSTKDDMTIENNKVNNFYVGDIINFAIIKCSVKYGDTYLGTAEITLLNSMEKPEDDEESGPDYSLVLHNGTQVFKYDESGLSPASGSLDEPQLILPLSFTVYNESGEKVSETELANATIQWIVPTENTMLKLTSVRDPDITNEDSVIYQNDFTANYLIRDEYDIGRSNNTITLIVQYDGNILTATTNFTFIKDGEPGTNGTEYICKIIPNVAEGDVPLYPTIMNGKLNYTPPMDECWFKVQLWRNGEKIFENNTSGDSFEASPVELEWSILRNKYTSDILDVSAITVTDSVNGYFNYNGYITGDNAPANIIKCRVKYKDLYYYATLPLITGYTNDTSISLQVEDYTGFRYAVYTTDGVRPQYDDRKPFIIKVLPEETYEYVSRMTEILGKIYDTGNDIWIDNINLESDDLREIEEDLGWPRFQPKDQYSGECVTNAIEYTIYNPDGNEIGKIHIPIHLMLNRYGNSAFNDWDGNSISINNDGGFILAPQVGAGRKETDNSFTGILMGEVKEAGKSKVETGLFGYSSGQRSIFLNAENGTAIFGSGGGKIIVDPTKPVINIDENGKETIIATNPAMLYSANYWKSYDEYGLPSSYRSTNEGNTGLLIDLSTPRIKYGNGNFSVDEKGNLTANNAKITGTIHAGNGGTIGGWYISGEALVNESGSITLSPQLGITVGDSFQVTPEGDIKLTGTINWGDTPGFVSQVYALYAEDQLNTPTKHYSEYNENSTTDWHTQLNVSADLYASYSYDNGNTWTEALKLQGQDGATGPQGPQGEPGDNADVPPYIRSTYIDFTKVASPKIITNSLDIYGSYAGYGNGDTGIHYRYYTNSSQTSASTAFKLGYFVGDYGTKCVLSTGDLPLAISSWTQFYDDVSFEETSYFYGKATFAGGMSFSGGVVDFSGASEVKGVIARFA